MRLPPAPIIALAIVFGATGNNRGVECLSPPVPSRLHAPLTAAVAGGRSSSCPSSWLPIVGSNHGFAGLVPVPRSASTAMRMAAGKGMGMGGSGSSSSPKKKKGGGSSSGGGMGMGGGGGSGGKKGKKKSSGRSATAAAAAPFDAAASLLRNERLYDEICRDALKEEAEGDEDMTFDTITSEYMLTARSSCSPTTNAVSDWVPVAQLVLVRPISDDAQHDEQHKDIIRAAVSEYCREVNVAACLAAPVFKSVPRNDVQYGAEPLESFHRYVYDHVIEGKNSAGTTGAAGEIAMTKAEARTVLDLEEGMGDVREIKSAYRKRSFQLHPDRFVGVERTEEQVRDAAKEFGDVKIAYETLSSGVRDSGVDDNTGGVAGKRRSWYESLGGRSRTDFFGPIELLPLSGAKKTVDGQGCKSAVVGLDHDLSMAFVARNQAAAATTR